MNQAQQKPTKGRPAGRGGPQAHMNLAGEKAKDFKRTMARLTQFLAPYRWAIIAVVVLAMASAIFSIVGPKFLGTVTTELFQGVIKLSTGGQAAFNFEFIAQTISLLLVLYILSALFNYTQGYIMAGVAQRLAKRLRSLVVSKIDQLPLQYFDKTSHGDILSRITNDIDTLTQTFSQSMSQIISSVTTVLGVLAMMLSISITMTLLALTIIPLSILLTIVIVKRTQHFFKDQQVHLGKVNGHVEEMLGAHQVVKAFSGEKKSVEQFALHNNALYQTAWKAQFLSGLMMPVLNVVSKLGYVAVTILGGSLAAAGTISVGDIQAFIQYVQTFNHPIMNLANISNILQQTAAAAERVFKFLDEPDEIIETDTPVPKSAIKGHVHFDQISFGYQANKPVINSFSADIKHGTKVAIVGPTGAGKTTIVKLLMRFYDVDSGAILIDGHNIKDFTRGDLRTSFGMVLQDTWLFNGTIQENIRYGRLSASDEQVIDAAKAAHADHFIKTLPSAYQAVINEETTNLSEGQKQLLTIARAILADPKILIFDEATSSVDTRTEVQIQRAMDHLMKDRTSFIIAHRLSTIKNADLILVLNNGDIVEQGTHQALLEKGGFYTELYNSQFDIGDISA